jgi:hypothetical protein
MQCHSAARGRRGIGFALAVTAAVLAIFVAARARDADEAKGAAPAAAQQQQQQHHEQAGDRPQPGSEPHPQAKPAIRPTTRPTARQAEADEETTDDFIRFVEDDAGGGRLESAIVTYRNANGVMVHLVAALHVGEASYYDGLSKTFKTYDALLYELIKPRGMAAPQPGVRSGGAVSGLQRFLKDVLELEFQLDKIDYTAPNFVHADLDAETFFSLQEERGESLLTLMFRSMLSEMQRQSAGTGARPITIFDLLAAMNSPDSGRQYKLLLARQFQDIEAQIAGVEGKEGTVLVAERNKAALKVLRETIGAGKKNIGVFYGAGHMRGLENALVGEMGFRRTGTEWRVAWDMTQPAEGAGAATRPATGATTRASRAAPVTIRPTTRPAGRPAPRTPAPQQKTAR